VLPQIIDATIAFANNFTYNPYSLKYLMKELYTDDEWAQIIYNEIKNKRPILYGGSTKTKEGHAFVFDGINTEGNVDVNWGWGGACDGWYDIFDLTPSGLGEEFSSGTTFSEGNDMILGFDPHQHQVEAISQYGQQTKIVNLQKLLTTN
jgi:hypothetical protein